MQVGTSPLVAAIDGGDRTVGVSEPLTLDASASYDPDVPMTEVDGNDLVPSRSFYNDHVTAVSCLARGMGEQDFSRFGTTTFSTTTESQTFFTDLRALHTSLSQEQCSVVCEQVCRSFCVHEHMSVHQLFEQLNAWECSSWVELPSCDSLRVTPPLVPPRAQAAPTPPGARPEQRGSWPWLQERASGRPEEEDVFALNRH